MKVEVATPDEYQGDLLGDINRRRGHILNIEAKNGQTILNAQVPLAEMFGYATAIRSLSKGRASYSMEPLTFEQVPNSVLNKILDAAARNPRADVERKCVLGLRRRVAALERQDRSSDGKCVMPSVDEFDTSSGLRPPTTKFSKKMLRSSVQLLHSASAFKK